MNFNLQRSKQLMVKVVGILKLNTLNGGAILSEPVIQKAGIAQPKLCLSTGQDGQGARKKRVVALQVV